MSDKIEKKVDGLTFGDAIHYMKNGSKMARSGWNGKGMWIAINRFTPVSGDMLTLSVTWNEFIFMKTAQETLVPWLASQTDMLAEDWMEV